MNNLCKFLYTIYKHSLLLLNSDKKRLNITILLSKTLKRHQDKTNNGKTLQQWTILTTYGKKF